MNGTYQCPTNILDSISVSIELWEPDFHFMNVIITIELKWIPSSLVTKKKKFFESHAINRFMSRLCLLTMVLQKQHNTLWPPLVISQMSPLCSHRNDVQ